MLSVDATHFNDAYVYVVVPTKPGDVVCLKWCLPPLIHHYK